MGGSFLYICGGILLFAISTSILYIIGIKRRMTEEKRLTDMLINNGAVRVINYLKKHDTITADGIGYLIKEIKAKEFMSSKTAIVQDGRAFQKRIIEFMLERNYIEEAGFDKGKKTYRLAEKKRSK